MSHNHNHNHDHGHDHCDDHDHGGCCCGHSHSHAHTSDSRLAHFRNEIITGILMISALIFFHYTPLSEIWQLCVYLLAVLPVGIPILKSTFKEWSKGDIFNEFTLMVIASAGAFLIGEYAEAVAVLLFYSFGEKLEDVVSGDVKGQIKKLLGKIPKQVTIEKNGVTQLKKPEDVEIGEIILVRPGDSVPLDGTLLGNNNVDINTSAMTGESLPRSFAPGSEINSGMIPIGTAIRLQATRVYSDSSMSRIIRMIEDASKNRAPSETILRRITRWYTPLVLICAILLMLIPWIAGIATSFDFVWSDWLRRSLVFLVCSCPCALIVSIPLAYFASIGLASKQGILFKGHRQLDMMRKISSMLFDKTGTVTSGKFSVTEVKTYGEMSSDEALALVAAVERESNHPLAEVIIDRANGLKLPEVTDIHTVNHGLEANLNSHKIVVGSPKLMKANNIKIETLPDSTSVCLAIDGKLEAIILMADTVKEGVVEAVEQMRKLGIEKIGILSGDSEGAVKRVAESTGMDFYKAALLPADKLSIIEENKGKDKVVGFAGDGINDAPALAASDLGIAMGRLGSDIAIESADVVIATDDLRQIPKGIKISRRVKSLLVENISFAFGVKILVMTLGAFGIATLWAAVFADTGVTLLTVIWTLCKLKIWNLKS